MSSVNWCPEMPFYHSHWGQSTCWEQCVRTRGQTAHLVTFSGAATYYIIEMINLSNYFPLSRGSECVAPDGAVTAALMPVGVRGRCAEEQKSLSEQMFGLCFTKGLSQHDQRDSVDWRQTALVSWLCLCVGLNRFKYKWCPWIIIKTQNRLTLTPQQYAEWK